MGLPAKASSELPSSMLTTACRTLGLLQLLAKQILIVDPYHMSYTQVHKPC